MSVVIPKASVLEIVVANDCLSFNHGRILSGKVVEKKIGGVIVMATKEAASHSDFESLLDKIRETVESREQSRGVPSRSVWCHYHKAKVGHTIDECPDVRCKTCRFLGHTDRVYATPKCDKCSKYGHNQETCTQIKCDSCGRLGHSFDQCYHDVVCERCDTQGHPTEKCRKPDQPKPVWCSFCDIEGDHPTSGCEDLKYHSCETCGEKGHFFKNCRSPRGVASFGGRPPRSPAIDIPASQERTVFIADQNHLAPLVEGSLSTESHLPRSGVPFGSQWYAPLDPSSYVSDMNRGDD